MIVIDLKALRYNVLKIKSQFQNSKFLAVVKDNAYGHGINTVVQEINSMVDGFGVISLKEAFEVRKHSPIKPIILFQGIYSIQDLETCILYNLSPLIHNQYQIELFEQKKFTKKIKPWIKINIGLNRLGFKPNQLNAILSRLRGIKTIDFDNICIISHLSSVQLSVKEKNEELQLFHSITHNLPFEKSLLSSAGILKFPQSHYNWIRPGLLMYGISPFPNQTGSDYKFHPVMSLIGIVIAKHHCSPGETIGYNKTWTCNINTTIAIINIGYASGYPFHNSNNLFVLVNGEYAHIIGQVSSDAIAIDITNINAVNIGTKVILWGAELPIEIVARQSKTIPDQLLCCVNEI